MKRRALLFSILFFTVAVLCALAFAEDNQKYQTEDIIQGNQPTPNPAKSATVSIAAVGDMMLGNWGEDLLEQKGANYPFKQVAPYLKKVDIATGNLEGPHCTRGEAAEKKYTFRIKPKWLEGYQWAGFDVLTLGNNHSMDFGAECFLENIALLKKRGIKVCGGGVNVFEANKPAVIEANGITAAFLGYSATYPKEAWAGPSKPGTVFPERSRLIKAVQDASAKYNVVVVHFHWGREGWQNLRDYQPELARLVIDNGADLVIGHHPHNLQGVEKYKGRLIFYSLGNFTFASYSKRAKTSAIALVTFNKKGEVTEASVVPLNVYNYEVHLQPVPLPGDPGIIAEINQASGLIEGGVPAVVKQDGMISIK